MKEGKERINIEGEKWKREKRGGKGSMEKGRNDEKE